MATVSGVWRWTSETPFTNPLPQENVNFKSGGNSYNSITVSGRGDNQNLYYGSELIAEFDFDNTSNTVWVKDFETYRYMDFGAEEQTITQQFRNALTSGAEEIEPVPTPDWANCFVKTDSGNKAVEKVWIKQNGQLVTVWDGGGGGGAAVDFATDSWETISAACKDGSYKTVYSVGDTKDITLSTGETITFAIMGFDHDDLSDGSGKAPITLGMTELLATKYPMNSTDTNAGGWDESEMRTSTMATLLTQLPSDLQAVIETVNKKATAGGASTSITTSADKLWLFAEVEIDGTTSAGYVDDGEQYEYWKTVKDGTVSADRIKYLSNGSGSAYFWWLRSPSDNSGFDFRCIGSTTGTVTSHPAHYAYGVSFGFCIG